MESYYDYDASVALKLKAWQLYTEINQLDYSGW